ncbi:hypothetical protein V8E36_008875 [Tilletia maclaganii]
MMKSFTLFATLSMLAVASASVDAPFRGPSSQDWPTKECVDLCKDAYSGRESECAQTCSTCGVGVQLGYLPTALREVPPNCQEVCRKHRDTRYCLPPCEAYQATCCHSVWGCCPHDARVCVRKQDTSSGN